MKILTEITYEENEKIQMLIEKKNALKNLIDLLHSQKGHESLLTSAEKEYQEICKLYDGWWDAVIQKYQFQQYDAIGLMVDCEKRIICYTF